MKVKMLISQVTANGSRVSGRVYDLPRKNALKLIAAGKGESAEGEIDQSAASLELAQESPSAQAEDKPGSESAKATDGASKASTAKQPANPAGKGKGKA